MSKFTRWAGIAHSILSKSHHKIKLGQVQEVLSAYFGHRTYASFRMQDLSTLETAKYVLVDAKLARERALSLHIPLTEEEWYEVEMALKPSGISGSTWLIPEQVMHSAARLTVEDSGDSRLSGIALSIGIRMGDGCVVTETRCSTTEGEYPSELRFTAEGKVRGYSDSQSLAVPIQCEVVFPRIGNRIYGLGIVDRVEQSGEPKEYEPEDPMFEFSYISGLDD